MKSYKSYHPSIWYEEDDKCFHGTVEGIRDVVHFEADSAVELEKAFMESVDDYLAHCHNQNVEPDKPYSGRIALRLAPEVHEMVSEAASFDAKSINQWIADTLREAAQERTRDGTIKIRIC
jgi:predicted HicB family RNase H-like nuclease